MIPDSYKPASWRCTLPVDQESGDLAIGINVGDEVVRVRLSIQHAEALAQTIFDAIEKHDNNQDPAAIMRELRALRRELARYEGLEAITA